MSLLARLFAPPEAGDTRARREGPTVPGAGLLGMRIFIASLSMLFAASVFGYLVVRLKATEWPPPGMPRLPSGLWLSTIVLLTCSLTIHLALRAIRQGETSASARWIWATLGLGGAFLAIQGVNWAGLIARNAAVGKNLYAFTFFMLTGLHAAHVLGGLAALVVVGVKSALGRYGSGWHPGVRYAAMYWHFLDVVWVLLFGVLLVFG